MPSSVYHLQTEPESEFWYHRDNREQTFRLSRGFEVYINKSRAIFLPEDTPRMKEI